MIPAGRDFYRGAMDGMTKTDSLLELLFFRPLRGTRGWTIYLLLLASFGVLYFFVASLLVGKTNLDVEAADQRSNIELAYASKADWFPHRSSYIQPLWPWLSRVVMDEDLGTFFTRGRWLNLSLGYAMTVLLAVLTAWWMAPVPGFIVAMLTGVGIMLQRAHFFQPEPLLYVLFLATVVFMALSLWRSRWIYYLGWGLFFGLASLTKGSMAPLLGLYAGATAVLLSIRAGWWPRWLVAPGAKEGWSLSRHAVGTAAALAIIAILMAPGAVYKDRVHGDPLYSPFKYYMWVEDYENGVISVTPRIETEAGRASFAPGELPTAANYIRKHGWTHARERLTKGFSEMSWRFLVPVNKVNRALRCGTFKDAVEKGTRAAGPGSSEYYWRYLLGARGLYLAWLGVLAFVLLLVRLRSDGPPLFHSAWAPATLAFAVAMVLGYMLAFGWYGPIVGWRGERFTLTLYLPLLIGFLWSGHLLARETKGMVWKYAYAIGMAVILPHALVQTALLIAHPHFEPGL
jgi:hypothetical protein